MKHRAIAFLVMLLLVMRVDPARSQDPSAPAVPGDIALQTLLDRASAKLGKKFLVGTPKPATISVGAFDIDQITYPVLLTILKNNGLAAIRNDDVVSVMPETNVRLQSIPTASKDDPSLAEDEWVTRIVPVDHMDAVYMVPILRPIMPQAGHMAAITATNSILIVDRYGNAKRLTGIIRSIDADASSRTPSPSHPKPNAPAQGSAG